MLALALIYWALESSWLRAQDLESAKAKREGQIVAVEKQPESKEAKQAETPPKNPSQKDSGGTGAFDPVMPEPLLLQPPPAPVQKSLGVPGEAAAGDLGKEPAEKPAGNLREQRDKTVPAESSDEQSTTPPPGASPQYRQPLPALVPGFSRRALQMAETGLLEDRADGVLNPFTLNRAADPLGLAAANRVTTSAESFLDGVGGIPAAVSSELPGAAIPAGARVFRIGPAALRSAVNLGVAYSHTAGQGANGLGALPGIGAANGLSNRQTGDQVSLFTGFSVDAIIGKPATGHFLTVAYDLEYIYPPSQAVNGEGDRSINQSLSVAGRLDFAKLRLGLAVSFASLSGVNRDTGGAVDRDLLGLSLDASYPLGAKTTLDSGISIPIRQFSQGVSTGGFSSTNTINYRFSAKTSMGVGVSFGWERDHGKASFSSANSSSSSDQNQKFARLLSTVSFQPTPLISLSGNLGVEFRDEEGENQISPILDLHARWAPRRQTAITLGVQQTVQTSAALAGQNFVSTFLSLGLSEQLGERISLSASLGYEHATYQSITKTISDGRTDNLYSAQIGASLALNKRWSASLAYVFSDNSSSQKRFQFNSSEVLLEMRLSL